MIAYYTRIEVLRKLIKIINLSSLIQHGTKNLNYLKASYYVADVNDQC